MDDVKDKVKGFMKKVNKPFSSSSSGKFKGQGRVLGSSSSGSTNPIPTRPYQNVEPKRNPPSTSQSSNSRSSPSVPKSDQDKPLVSPPNSSNGFDPFDSLITSGKISRNGHQSLNVFECPVCRQSYRSEEEVSVHIDSCVGGSNENSETVMTEFPDNRPKVESGNAIGVCIGTFVSGKLSEGSVEVVLKLLGNIVKEPSNAKFRRIRMSNPKIREAIGEVAGGVELLECVGFRLQEEGDEIWAMMDVPSEEQIILIKEALLLLEPQKMEDLPSTTANGAEGSVEPPPQKIDRQVRVYFSVPENIAAKIDLPDSFYNLSMEDLKKEADMRKKKIAESQLLIPKSYKEKQAKAARKKYKTTVIRIQFPDEVVLQGVFLPWEPTTALYEFVSSSLKEPSLEFELWHPAMLKRRVIPRFPRAGERTPTLDEEDLVPSALIKFKPVETDSVVFTGLSNELLEISEPLTTKATVPPT